MCSDSQSFVWVFFFFLPLKAFRMVYIFVFLQVGIRCPGFVLNTWCAFSVGKFISFALEHFILFFFPPLSFFFPWYPSLDQSPCFLFSPIFLSLFFWVLLFGDSRVSFNLYWIFFFFLLSKFPRAVFNSLNLFFVASYSCFTDLISFPPRDTHHRFQKFLFPPLVSVSLLHSAPFSFTCLSILQAFLG